MTEEEKNLSSKLQNLMEKEAGKRKLTLQQIENLIQRHKESIQNVSEYDLTDTQEYYSHWNLISNLGTDYTERGFRKFDVDDNNSKLIQFLLYYFNGCRYAQNVFPEENYKVHKNLLLVGEPGTGKTMLMQIFADYLKLTCNPNAFENLSVTQMMNYYKIHGHIDLYTYNSGPESASLNSILGKSEMKDMDIIFGPLYQQHIKPLAEFAKKQDTRLVIPFTSKDNTVFQNPAVYQINTPQSYLYSEVYDHFVRQFPNANVIFIEASQGTKDKAEFIKGLKDELRNRSIPMKSLKEDVTVESLKTVLRTDRENIFIPTSGSNLTLIKILPQLTLLVREQPESRIHLFGYPEWQTYTKDHLEAFFELDTYFYSSFYTNNLLPAAINFTKNYRRWYGKEMDERYPKFGMLGFDTGYFFLKGLARYGSSFEKNMQGLDLVPIQTGFKFQRVNNWGGFINKKVFFVHFTKNFELVKLDFD